MEPGSLADWVSGTATAGALIVGFYGLYRERLKDRELNAKIAEEQQLREEIETASQASKVSSWYDQSSDSFYIRNASESVIYDAYVLMVNGGFVSDGTALLDDEIGQMVRIVPPGSTIPVAAIWRYVDRDHYAPSCDLTFRDAQGITWLRNNWGKLERREEDVFTHYRLEKPYKYYEPPVQVF